MDVQIRMIDFESGYIYLMVKIDKREIRLLETRGMNTFILMGKTPNGEFATEIMKKN